MGEPGNQGGSNRSNPPSGGATMAQPEPPVEQAGRDNPRGIPGADQLLFSRYLHEEDRPALRKAFLIAALLHLFVISISIPDFSVPDLPMPPRTPPVVIRRPVLPPPPGKQRPERPKVETVITKRVPIPDPTPEEPEPIFEPAPVLQGYVGIALDPEILIRAPEAPPATDGVLFPGMGGVTNPELIVRVEPIYPESARRAGLEGQVVLQCVCKADSSIADCVVLKTPGAKFGFDEAAIHAVKEWKYKPALQFGKPVTVHFSVVVNFRLQ